MSVPGIVQSALGDEPVAAQVGLGGEDQLYVTPSRILIYRGEGLLSDAGIEEYAHRAERVDVSEGRRKAKITLRHDLEGERSFSVQPSGLDDVLHPVLAGVLSTAGVTDAGETVKQTYRFSELTLIITSKRLVKHIGSAVWDGDYEEFRFEDTTDLDFEEGSVATQIVMEVDGRRERIKAPNDEAPEVRAHLEDALFEFYDVGSLEEFRSTVAEAEGEATGSAPDPEETAGGNQGVAFESDLSPLRTGPDDEEGQGTAEAFLDDDGAGTAEPAAEDLATDGPSGTAGADAGGAADAGAGDGTVDAGGVGDRGTDAGEAGGGGTDPLEPGAASGGQGSNAGSQRDQSDSATGGQVDDVRATDRGGHAAGQEPAGAGVNAGAGGDPAIEEGAVEAAGDRVANAELERQLDEIARSVNKQNELLKRHQRTMEKLIDELQQMND
jgi:hypothetical protein